MKCGGWIIFMTICQSSHLNPRRTAHPTRPCTVSSRRIPLSYLCSFSSLVCTGIGPWDTFSQLSTCSVYIPIPITVLLTAILLVNPVWAVQNPVADVPFAYASRGITCCCVLLSHICKPTWVRSLRRRLNCFHPCSLPHNCAYPSP